MASVKRVKPGKVRMDAVDVLVDDGIDKDLVEKEVVSMRSGKAVERGRVPRKIRMSMSKREEKKLDREIERDDNMSIALMVLILVLCFVVGISLGYVLYRIAINGVL